MEQSDELESDDETTIFSHDDLRTILLSSESKKSSYEDAIYAAGYGRFHYVLLFICGWALSSDSLEILSIGFVLDPAKCEMKLSGRDEGLLTASLFLGMLLGGYIWGGLADVYGRRFILLISLPINGIGGLMSCFCYQYSLFFLCRFISGIGVGGSMPVIFSFFTEFQPKDKRGGMISMLAIFWMTGNILAAVLAWLIVPQQQITLQMGSLVLDSWRIYLAICTIPCFTSAICFFFLPESPKYLMENGDEVEAMKVFHRIHRKNTSKYAKYPIEGLEITHRNANHRFNLKMSAHKIFLQTINLYKSPLVSTSLKLSLIYFTLSFGYYGLFLWFPKIFARVEKFGGSICSPYNSSQIIQTVDTFCDTPISSTVYLESLYTALSNLPGNLVAFFLMDRTGANPLLAASMVISAVCVFLFSTIKNSLLAIVIPCIFSAISTIGWVALDVIGMELYPTQCRSTANGVMLGIGRIGSQMGALTFGLLTELHCVLPLLICSVLLCVGGLSSLFLPKHVRENLQ